MNENEQSCGMIPRVSNQYPSSLPSSSSSVFPPTFSPLDPFLCSYNFPILLSSVETEELTCVWQREIYTRQQEVLPLSGPFFFSLALALSLSWLENEQHLLLLLLYSLSKESIMVTTAIEKNYKDSVSALLTLTKAKHVWGLGWGYVEITGGGHSRGAGVDFTDLAHITSSEGFQIQNSNYRLSHQSEKVRPANWNEYKYSRCRIGRCTGRLEVR